MVLTNIRAIQAANYPPGTVLDRSVWGNTTPEMVEEAYGHKFHPFGADGTFRSGNLFILSASLGFD